MKGKRKRIPDNIKAEIVSKALDPNCRIADLAKSYGVAAWTIYCWRKESTSRLASASDTTSYSTTVGIKPTSSTHFVEVKLEEPNIEEELNNAYLNLTSSSNTSNLPSKISPNSASNSTSTLLKASLTFKHFSLALEGKINPSNLLKAIKILEESC